jgi:hypothetical protein
MERAPLRPVPSRPQGPVDPDRAAGHVSAELPGLDGQAARALALVALVGRPRGEVAVERGVSPNELGELLRRARKELRRSLTPLAGSGWCERAERLISDRMDGGLEPPGPARLEAHLRNCSRCVEHERRLTQATDALVASFAERHGVPQPAEEAAEETGPPALEVVERSSGSRAVPWRPVILEPWSPRPPEEAPQPEEPAPAEAAVPLAEAPPAAARAERVVRPVSLAWGVLFALAVLLAVAGVALAVLGALGGSL